MYGVSVQYVVLHIEDIHTLHKYVVEYTYVRATIEDCCGQGRAVKCSLIRWDRTYLTRIWGIWSTGCRDIDIKMRIIAKIPELNQKLSENCTLKDDQL